MKEESDFNSQNQAVACSALAVNSKGGEKGTHQTLPNNANIPKPYMTKHTYSQKRERIKTITEEKSGIL